jgi:hypothetical protein
VVYYIALSDLEPAPLTQLSWNSQRSASASPELGLKMSITTLGLIYLFKKKKKKDRVSSPVIVAHAFNPSTWEAEALRSL